MKILVDDKIPYIGDALSGLKADVVYMPGIRISRGDVRDADALMVRTRTRCNRDLLYGSKVSFVVTATIGCDHLDIDFLERAGIAWANCPGCNATSVAQYVHSCLLLLKRERGVDLQSVTFGIIGYGHVGRAVAKAVASLGVRVVVNDPPLQQSLQCPEDSSFSFESLRTLAERCDIISFHTPLVRKGDFPTYHLADEAFFDSLARKPWIINTSRGEVVSTSALKRAIEKGIVAGVVIDTWENEPNIDAELLNLSYIATPHIAGYSADGKANASRMALTALCNFFHLDYHFEINPPNIPLSDMPSPDLSSDDRVLWLYNPKRDSVALQHDPLAFELLRENYPLRRERFS